MRWRRLLAALAGLVLLGACRDAPRSIRSERVAHQPVSERNDLATNARMLWSRPPPPPNECEPGDVGACLGKIVPIRGATRACPCTHCLKMRDGVWRWNRAECNTPLVVSFDDEPVEFTRAGAAFPIGVSVRTEWVSAKTPWLALDRDGSGCIESARELFAGFETLAELDANGDGVLDARDPAYAELVLWSDRDQDKRCSPGELAPLSSRVARLPLAFTRREPAPLGSYEGETAALDGGGRLVDVYLDALD